MYMSVSTSGVSSNPVHMFTLRYQRNTPMLRHSHEMMVLSVCIQQAGHQSLHELAATGGCSISHELMLTLALVLLLAGLGRVHGCLC